MFYDCHMHTTNSDGRNSTLEMCESAIEKGLDGIIITDHADMNFYNERNTYERIKKSMNYISIAQKKYEGKLNVLKGIELGEYTIAPKKAEEVLSLNCFDAVLCSVHYVPKAGWFLAYNRIDFSDETISDDDINEYLKLYSELLSETVDCFDFDILSHIQCPVRYTTAKHKRKTDIRIYEDKICEILEKIIKRNIALEINTAVFGVDYEKYNMQSEFILNLYKSMGGKMVTLGSDAHSIAGISTNFTTAAKMLKKCGFESIYYFENRQAKEIFI